MTRRREENDTFAEFISRIIVIYLVYLAVLYFSNRANFWRWFLYGIAAIAVFVAAVYLRAKATSYYRKRHLNKILDNLQHAGMEERLINFINRFGFENSRKDGWSFRNRKFDWDRINDLKKELLENGIIKKEKDVFKILQFYIQEKEEKLTRESIRKEPQKFSNLSGTEFEKLLYRLFEAMGYKVELIGKSGDQGGDLIANNEGERILIQAKCYRDWSTGNSAVQQVVGAIKYYDCSKAMVITTSYFTDEAMALAHANKTELIARKRLQELLQNFLGESWY